MTENGGHVYFAKTAEDATRYICNVAKQKNAKKIVKSKSMVTEEIGMNKALQNEGIEIIETDLGEYILQLDNDPLLILLYRRSIKIATKYVKC